MTSSMTNRTAEMGALKAAAKPAAAPTGAISRTFSRDSRNRRPSADAIPAPVCSQARSSVHCASKGQSDPELIRANKMATVLPSGRPTVRDAAGYASPLRTNLL